LETIICICSQRNRRNTFILEEQGFKSLDALHIASAIEGKANFFLTTDNGILKKKHLVTKVIILNPINFFEVYNNEN
jgi:predicted nucleic acid-binding protein